MFRVIHSGMLTEHATEHELAARLAACCTFTYADHRDIMRNALRTFTGILDVWLVYSPSANTWRIVPREMGARTYDGEATHMFTIDGHKSEGEHAREIFAIVSNTTIPTCPGCKRPAHASESDDDHYHAGCRPEGA